MAANVKVRLHGDGFSYFTNKACEYFPCHRGVKEDEFNCLFCYCPLYVLKDRCGGNFRYMDSGIKDCSSCTVPHHKKNYDYIISKFSEIMAITRKDSG